jgi:hypothetical protein
MQKPKTGFLFFSQPHPESARLFKKVEGSDDICLYEILWAED